MVISRRAAYYSVLLIIAIGAGLAFSGPHWLLPHGRATCRGKALADARVFRSQQGDLFVYAPKINIQLAIISPNSRDLGRCNTPAFTPLFGLLFSRESEPSIQCTAMWKGAGSNDVIPAHLVTDKFAEFPWGSCPDLKVEY